MAKRIRRAARKVATTALAVARRTGGVARRTATRVVTRIVPVAQAIRRSPRVRRAASAVVKGGSALAIGQAKILPAAVGGYLAGKVERDQRRRHGAMIGAKAEGKTAGGAMIENPTYRLMTQLGLAAFAASRLQGMAKEAVQGYAGGVGALYELYAATDGNNPGDSYLETLKAGGAGV